MWKCMPWNIRLYPHPWRVPLRGCMPLPSPQGASNTTSSQCVWGKDRTSPCPMKHCRGTRVVVPGGSEFARLVSQFPAPPHSCRTIPAVLCLLPGMPLPSLLKAAQVLPLQISDRITPPQGRTVPQPVLAKVTPKVTSVALVTIKI